jgi:lipid-A-disaccharide synthase
MKDILAKDPTAEIRFWGGDLMQSVGGTLVKHYKELSFMGFLEVVLNLKTIKTTKQKNTMITLTLH